MMQRRLGLGIFAILAISACNAIVGVEDVELTSGAGATGGSAGNGGMAGAGMCTVASTCPGMDEPCRIRTCIDGVCGFEYAASGTDCGAGGECNEVGICQGKNGTTCTDGTNCAQGFCVDGVCCNSSCTGTCEACNVTGSMGTCSAMPNGLDDATGNAVCLGPDVACDGTGKCLREVGGACATAADCFSTLCNHGVCTGNSGVDAQMAKNCGPTKEDSCNQTRVVPGGLFNRLNDVALPAEVSEFNLDRFEVTLGRFRQFLAAYDLPVGGSKPAPGAGAHPKIPGSGWNAAWPIAATSGDMAAKLLNCEGHYPKSWTAAAGNAENLPMDCMTWEEAFAFCAWDGGRLPTEAEWHYAAAGGANQRFYPWSDPPVLQNITYEHAVYDCAPELPVGSNVAGACTLGDILPPGSKSPKGDTDFGHSDMAGNMYEWTRDAFVAKASLPVPCIDCAVLGAIGNKDFTYRGGGWSSSLYQAQNVFRGTHVQPTTRHHDIGFRCARDIHPTCGNGVVDAGEYCDDASLDPNVALGCTKCDKVKKVVAGDTHACVVTHMGKLKCWGDNAKGQLGQGNTTTIKNPAQWPRIPLPPVNDVALSKDRTCVLFKDGAVRCFGADNVDGLAGLLGTSTPVMQPIGDNPDELKNLQAVGLLRPAISIVSGKYHSCALLDDGTIQCWGMNQLGGLGVGNTMDYQGAAGTVFSPGVKAMSIAASYDATCALLMDGSAACWGLDAWGSEGATTLQGVLGLNTDTQYARGDEMDEMLGANLLKVVLPTPAALPIATISGGGNTYCVSHDGSKTVRCWGANDRGQLGRGSHIHWGAKQFGTDMLNLTAIELGATFTPARIVAGQTHTCVISDDGRLKCFGSNDSGELGLGLAGTNVGMMDFGIGDADNEMGDNLPEVNLGTDRVQQLSLGYQLTCALLQNSRVKCWGKNDLGQTGVLQNDLFVGDDVLPDTTVMPQLIKDIPYVDPL